MSVAELHATMAQQPVAAPSESSDDPPVVPLNLPVDGTAPVFAGEPTDPPSPGQREPIVRASTPAGDAGPAQSRYGTPRLSVSVADGVDRP
eukprot:11818447-Alexandrium_andersonii.AAC.1